MIGFCFTMFLLGPSQLLNFPSDKSLIPTLAFAPMGFF